MTDLKYGVPQGSCSGANIFTVYSSLIKNAVDDTFTLNAFADDHSICRDYVAGNTNEMNNLKKDLKKNLDSIGHWMDQMRLKLNPDKTELISFGGRAQLKNGTIGSIGVGDATVKSLQQCQISWCPSGSNIRLQKTSHNEDTNSQI